MRRSRNHPRAGGPAPSSAERAPRFFDRLRLTHRRTIIIAAADLPAGPASPLPQARAADPVEAPAAAPAQPPMRAHAAPPAAPAPDPAQVPEAPEPWSPAAEPEPPATGPRPQAVPDTTWLEPLAAGEPGAEILPVAVPAEFGSGRRVPDTLLDGWSTDSLTVRAASIRGRMHRYNGAPRQDAVALLAADDGATLYLAVADGVSAARFSHRGAEAAARYAVGWLAKCWTPEAEVDWSSLAKGAAWQVQSLAEPDKGAQPTDFATTLVCAAVRRRGDRLVGSVFSVGDSGSWVLSAGPLRLLEGGKAAVAEGEVATSAVRPLPYPPASLDVADFEVAADEVLLIGTDGIGDPIGGGGGPLTDLLRERLVGRLPTVLEFGHVTDFSKAGFDDDRTLVAVWPCGAKER